MNPISEQKTFFNDLACEWDQINHSSNISALEKIIRTKIPNIMGPVLDVGSGTGILMPLIARNSSNYVYELDVAENMLRQAQLKLRGRNHHALINGDAHHIPLANGSIGTAFCFCVYPHFHNPHLAVSEIRRVLRYGGYLVILHLMNHHELNEMHASKSQTVANDVLPPANLLAARLEHSGYIIRHCEEKPGLYLVIAAKV